MTQPRSFSAFKKKSNPVDYLQNKIKDQTERYEESENLWKPLVNRKGEGEFKIRFLPSQYNEVPWARVYSYGFQNHYTGLWFIENSPQSNGDPCPVNEANLRLRRDGHTEKAKLRPRRTSYFANVLVVDDPANAQNNGEVFVYRFGNQIFKKIEEQIKKGLNPFDILRPMTFVLKAHVGANKMRSYESSYFLEPTETASEAQAEALFVQTFNLDDYAPIKSYDKLLERLRVVDPDEANRAVEPSRSATEVLAAPAAPKPVEATPVAPAPAPAPAPPPAEEESPFVDDEDEDDVEAFFNEV